eukprot:gb/GECG01002725.1/.p1 GENE.gb/GECG01002725.1/~~gb/GECG01002725.1/.p1  ORF type:complete len:214 (+),score=47.19 gb/GECG01002725.1/:1-642(+)
MEDTPWEVHEDPDSGAHFYFNPETGVTQWERPEELGPEPEGEEAAPEDVEVDAADNLENWAEAIDPDSGAKFYYNAVTEVTQWDPPPGWPTEEEGGAQEETPIEDGDESPQAAARRRRTTMANQKKQAEEPQTVEEKLAARARKFIQMRKAEKIGSKAAAFATNSAMQPIAGKQDVVEAAENGSAWQPVTDENTGSTYYFNPTTGETRWDPPE